jgi:hypothetical protein
MLTFLLMASKFLHCTGGRENSGGPGIVDRSGGTCVLPDRIWQILGDCVPALLSDLDASPAPSTEQRVHSDSRTTAIVNESHVTLAARFLVPPAVALPSASGGKARVLDGTNPRD